MGENPGGKLVLSAIKENGSPGLFILLKIGCKPLDSSHADIVFNIISLILIAKPLPSLHVLTIP